jgi:hypothetical protein
MFPHNVTIHMWLLIKIFTIIKIKLPTLIEPLMVLTFNKNKNLKHQRFNKNYYLIELKHTHTHIPQMDIKFMYTQ